MVVGLRFIYYRHTIPTTEEVASEKLLILIQVIRCFNSKGCLQLLGDITGDYSVREVNFWTSRYDANHHLSIDMDENPTQGGIAAQRPQTLSIWVKLMQPLSRLFLVFRDLRKAKVGSKQLPPQSHLSPC